MNHKFSYLALFLFALSLFLQTLVVYSQEKPTASATTAVPTTTLKPIPTTKKPVPKRSWNESCTAESDCKESLYCNKESLCSCKFGFKEDTKQNETCIPIQCSKNEDCGVPNSICIKDNKTCDCSTAEGFQLEPFTQKCLIPLGEKAQKSEFCSTGTFLSENKTCECLFGYFKSNIFDCIPYSCSDDLSCEERFGLNLTEKISAKCRKESKISTKCECFPPNKFQLDPISQKCKSVVDLYQKSISIDCEAGKNLNETCGPNSVCVDKKCACEVGFYAVPSGNKNSGLGCQQFDCLDNEECGYLFSSTVCKNAKKICKCADTFYLDDSGLSCLKETNYFAIGAIGAAVVMLFGPLVFFLGQRMACGKQ